MQWEGDGISVEPRASHMLASTLSLGYILSTLRKNEVRCHQLTMGLNLCSSYFSLQNNWDSGHITRPCFGDKFLIC